MLSANSNDSLVGIVRRSPRRLRYLSIGVMLVLVLAVGVLVIGLSAPNQPVSAWWPAAGISVAAVLAAAGPKWRVALLVWAFSTASNLVAGRPLGLSIGYGLANAAEAWVAASILTANAHSLRLQTMRDVWRLIVASFAGGAVAAALVAITAALGAGSNPLATFVAVTSSHASATILILPVVLSVVSSVAIGTGRERLLQLVVLVVVVVYVFSPTQTLPLAFLPLPVLTWAAFRFGTQFVAIELVIVAVTASLFTRYGGGPYAEAALDAGITSQFGSLLVQVFLLTYAASVLFLSAARNEREALVRKVAAREQLLRGGLVGAQVGFLILDRVDAHNVRVLQSNSVAVDLLGWPSVHPIVDLHHRADKDRIDDPFMAALRDILDAEQAEWSGELTLAGRRVHAFMTRLERDASSSIVTAQLIDVTARFESQQALAIALNQEREAVDKLSDLNRQKDDFVSSVSHELRTPITSILGFAQALDESVTDEDDRQYVQIILRNSHRLADLVESLLELGKMTTHNSISSLGTVHVNRVVEECLQEQQISATSRGVSVRLDLDDAAGEVNCAQHDLARIVSNLLTNSIKFTPPNGIVTISSIVMGDRVQIVVADTGHGISATDQKRVFERFYRSTHQSTRDAPGTGLGLSIVKGLVERLGGTIELESDGRSGTTVRVTLPAAAAIAAESVPATV